ncbi:MAG: sugar phosphate isomerase/epimerase [Acutalibacteraceae bacterium]|nr:sugar phosphate isomerase/epimerase [Acutalibacteraceae bacterium]
MEIGFQFYTIRDFCKDLEGFDEALKRTADIGYKNIQVSGTCDFEPAWLKEKLKTYGLKCVLTHNKPDKLLSDPIKVAKEHDVFGCDFVGLGYANFDEEDSLKKFISDYKPVSEALKANGKYFMYHNHAHEFENRDGKLIIEHIADNFDNELFGFTLDTFWVQAGGGNPAEWIERLSGRLPCIHIKDYGIKSSERKMMPVGEGNLNWAKIFEAAEKAGTKYMIVEQDDCNGEDPFACAKRSYDYLKSCGF